MLKSNAALTKYIDTWSKQALSKDQGEDELNKVKAELKQVKQHNRNMMNVLSDVEWYQASSNAGPSCPHCGEMQHKGHDVTCRLKKVLEK